MRWIINTIISILGLCVIFMIYKGEISMDAIVSSLQDLYELLKPAFMVFVNIFSQFLNFILDIIANIFGKNGVQRTNI